MCGGWLLLLLLLLLLEVMVHAIMGQFDAGVLVKRVPVVCVTELPASVFVLI